MSNIIDLIFFGFIGVVILQIFKPKTEGKTFIVLTLSFLTLYYYSKSLLFVLIIILWLCCVYFLQILNNKKHILYLYIPTVVFIFIAFKAGFFSTFEKNLLLESTVPIGFSFIMFHSIALLIDRTNNSIKEPIKIKEYFSSSLFFPTLVIGPFHGFQTFKEGINLKWSKLRTFHGYCLFCMGIFKFSFSGFLLKPFLLMSMPLMPHKEIHSINILILGSLYLYSNFSGYTDVVVGISKMMGFDIPLNFKFPFLSTSMAEYWRKWHITLGDWFKKYVYLPLNYTLYKKFLSNFNPDLTVKICIFITFFLIGIWHQFSYKILLYAIANALLVALFRSKIRNIKWLSILVTFILVLQINGLFLSRDIETYKLIIYYIFNPKYDLSLYYNIKVFIFAFFGYSLLYFFESVVEKISNYNFDVSTSRIVSNFILSMIMLYLGLTIGLGGVNSIYVGY